MKKKEVKNNNLWLWVIIILVFIFVFVPIFKSSLSGLGIRFDEEKFSDYQKKLEHIKYEIDSLANNDNSLLEMGVYSPLEITYKLGEYEKKINDIEYEYNISISDETYRLLVRTDIFLARSSLTRAKGNIFRVAVIGTNPTEEEFLIYRDWLWSLPDGEFEKRYEYYKKFGVINF